MIGIVGYNLQLHVPTVETVGNSGIRGIWLKMGYDLKISCFSFRLVFATNQPINGSPRLKTRDMMESWDKFEKICLGNEAPKVRNP